MFENISTTPNRQVSFCNPLESAAAINRWDRFVSECSDDSVFCRSAWLKVLSETYGYAPRLIAAEEDGNVRSALPVLEATSWLTGKRGISLPFTDEVSEICSKGFVSTITLRDLADLAHKRKWRYFELRGNQHFFHDAKPSVKFHGHKLVLRPDCEKTFERFDSSVRRAIRKAEKSNLKIQFGQTFEALTAFFKLHCKTRKEHGLPPQPFKFFTKIHEHVLLANLGVVVTAIQDSSPVASSVFFYSGSKGLYKFGASSHQASESRANNLVMWEAIKWLAERGVRELRFGRTSLNNDGLRRYKLGWGSEEYDVSYYRYDLRSESLVSMNDGSAGWYNRFFRKLPAPLSKIVGTLLYRHIA